MFDIKRVKEEAEKEMMEEKAKKAKDKLKSKIRDLDAAKKVVRNLEIELDDLMAEIGNE